MRYIVHDTEDYNADNSGFSSFNRIKWSSLVRPDYAVESIEGHGNYEEGTAECWGKQYCIIKGAEPILIWRHVNMMYHTQVGSEPCKNQQLDISTVIIIQEQIVWM